MLKRYSSYFLLLNLVYQYYVFFVWYLNDKQIQIEYAFMLGLTAFLSGVIFILFTHIAYFPKRKNNITNIPTYPPLIMLASLNLGFLVGISNLYLFQLYSLPKSFDVLRSNEIGFFIIVISLALIYSSVRLFREEQEDPNPTTVSHKLITTGIFKYTRNPMYLALILFQIGVGISLSFLHISIMSLLTIFLLHNYVIKREEFYLLKLFGQKYEGYMQQSRRWI